MPTKLFQPLKIGHVQLDHRIVMAPLTRRRADKNHVILPMAIDYYTQRCSAPGTLIISEACLVSARGGGAPHMPMISTPSQIKAWKNVTDAVHEKGCSIFCQLVALGRAASPEALEAEGVEDGFASSSAVAMGEGASVPRELSEEEIWASVSDFAQAATKAMEAGFDGVEIHGANGYLIDQFTQSTCNKRTDIWGGSPENRSRFAVQVMKAVTQAVGASRAGVRLSPFSEFQGMRMPEPESQFADLIAGLKPLNLAYLHLIESRVNNSEDVERAETLTFALEIWGGQSPVLVAGGFKAETAKRAVDCEYKGFDVAIAFGRYFISTPDLVFRVKNGVGFNDYDRSTFYTPEGEKGYLEYAFSEEFLASQRV